MDPYEEQTTGRGKRQRKPKYDPLQPKKTHKFKRVKVRQEEIQGSLSLQSQNHCLEILLLKEDYCGLNAEDFAGTVPVSSLPPCSKIPVNLCIVPYQEPVPRTRSRWKNINYHLSNYWNKKRFLSLSNHFNPIPFVREWPSNMAAHQDLLTRLGLWSFLHLDFEGNIHSDLIKQLIVHYNPKAPFHRRSHVNGFTILVNRAALARALALPTKRLRTARNNAAMSGHFMISDEEFLFLEELVFSWLVLQDEHCELPDEVMKIISLIRERRLEEVDWAGLIWCMVRSELLKGQNLVNCYYASHMQLLLKNQKPRLFVSDEENVNKCSSGLEMVNRAIALFGEEFEKERFLEVEESVVHVKESGKEQKMKTTSQRCLNRRNPSLKLYMGREGMSYSIAAVNVNDCKGEKLQDPENRDEVVTLKCREDEDRRVHQFNSPDDMLMNENTDIEGQGMPAGICNLNDQENSRQGDLVLNEDKCKLEEGVAAGDLFVGKSGELSDSLQRKQVKRSSDSPTRRMDIPCRQESETKQMEMVSTENKGKEVLDMDDMEDDCEIIEERIYSSDEQHAVQMLDVNREIIMFPSEAINDLSQGLQEIGLVEENVASVEPVGSEPGTSENAAAASSALEYFPVDICYEQAVLWVSRLRNTAERNARMNDEATKMLVEEVTQKNRIIKSINEQMVQEQQKHQNELEEKNRMIELIEKAKQEEEQKYKKDLFRYERQLSVMETLLEEYRKALENVNKSFARYRERAQLREPPIYIDHPEGGGWVVPAAELEGKLKRR